MVKADFLVRFDHVNDLSRLLLCKKLQRIKTFPVFRDTRGHHRHAAHKRQILHQIRNAAPQFLPVIDPLTADNLPVHLHRTLIETVQKTQLFPREPVVEHLTPKLWVCGLH